MDAIREKKHEQIGVGIDPQRRPRVASVAHGAARESFAPVGGKRGLDIPSEGPDAAGDVVRCQHRPGALFRQNARGAARSLAEHGLRVADHVAGGGEEAGVAGDASQPIGPGIVHVSHDPDVVA
jgi:hypothetical protein